MFLGRSTPQWAALIAAFAALTQIIIVNAAPDLDPVQVATVLGALTLALNALIAFLANTATTPIMDPRLQAGTVVSVTDAKGTVTGTTKV